MNKLLSLCIPTNGVSEWVFPVLDSIFRQNVDTSLYEVIVTNNGNNKDFENRIYEYCKKNTNLVYKKTNAYSFLNEIESYKLASGDFIKFINHRTILVDGALQYIVEFVEKNIVEKPVIYFTTGALNTEKKYELSTFDSFVRKLSYWSSWSTGMAFWKEDFQIIKKYDLNSFNELFPHTDILFSQKNKNNYIIDDKRILEEINIDDTKKGKYDLFYAFAVEYLSILLDLLRTHHISINTFNTVKNDNLTFVANLYYLYIKRKKPCSYDLSSFEESIKVYYSKSEIKRCFYKKIINKLLFRKKEKNSF